MTLHRLWTKTTPPFAKFNDSNPITIANAFYVVGVSGWTCRGIRVYWTADSVEQDLHVFAWSRDPAGNGSPLTSVASGTLHAMRGQWNELLWSSPIPMVSAQQIWLGYSPQTTNDYIAWTGVPAASVQADDGSPLYLAGGTEFGGRGRYLYQKDTRPTNAVNFSAGIGAIVDDGQSTVTPQKGVTIYKNGTEVPATVSYWNGTSEVAVANKQWEQFKG